MATPKPRTRLEFRENLHINATMATGSTTEPVLFFSDRDLNFREVGITAQQTVVSSAPATNTFRAEFWNFTDSTKLAQATITGASSGTQLERGSFVSIATKAAFLVANASAAKVFTMKFVGSGTLNRGIVNPVVSIFADVTN